MFQQQRTLQKEVSFSGKGLHTGHETTITLKPAPENSGRRFVRVDIDSKPQIPASVHQVLSTSRRTTLTSGDDSIVVHTTEHILAALEGCGIDNCIIELTSDEPPIGDGSSIHFVKMIQDAGVQIQKSKRTIVVIDKVYEFSYGNSHFRVIPSSKQQFTVAIDYNTNALSVSQVTIQDLEKEFITEFAPARTFCFLSEISQLQYSNNIKGGSLENAIVIVDSFMLREQVLDLIGSNEPLDERQSFTVNSILNKGGFRYSDEPARHKLLDLIGDSSLLGYAIQGHIIATRPGHEANINFVKYLQEQLSSIIDKISMNENIKKETTLSIGKILEVMPHRYPFLLVDRIISIDFEQNSIVGLKNVTINEPFFMGHFPNKPIMPGVLLLESMAQVGGLLLLNSEQDLSSKLVMLLGVNNVKFRKPVVPGDQLIMKVRLVNKRMNLVVFDAKCYVDDVLVTEAEIKAAIVDRTSI